MRSKKAVMGHNNKSAGAFKKRGQIPTAIIIQMFSSYCCLFSVPLLSHGFPLSFPQKKKLFRENKRMKTGPRLHAYTIKSPE